MGKESEKESEPEKERRKEETQERFLPITVQGHKVLVHVDGNTWRLDNSELQSKSKELGYRRSKQLDDKLGVGAMYGSTVEGTDTGDGWLKILPQDGDKKNGDSASPRKRKSSDNEESEDSKEEDDERRKKKRADADADAEQKPEGKAAVTLDLVDDCVAVED